jgi:hypothetical protein
VRFKIGKNQNGKVISVENNFSKNSFQAFDDSLRGMKKNGQRITMIGTTLYNIEVIRVCYSQ